jgi:hypothetical protein
MQRALSWLVGSSDAIGMAAQLSPSEEERKNIEVRF